MYYILTHKVQNERGDAILHGEITELPEAAMFTGGISLNNENLSSAVNFSFEEFTLRGVMTDHLNANDIPGPVFSSNAKSLFEEAAIKNIEYYPLTLIDEFPPGKKNGRENEKPKPIEYKNYFIANVVGLVDCVDHEKSVLEYFYPPELRNKEKTSNQEDDLNDPFAGENPNDIDFITHLVLDETKIDPQLKVFRLKDQPNLLVFHESIVELIRKEKLSGFVFVPVSKYTDAIEDEETEVSEAQQEK